MVQERTGGFGTRFGSTKRNFRARARPRARSDRHIVDLSHAYTHVSHSNVLTLVHGEKIERVAARFLEISGAQEAIDKDCRAQRQSDVEARRARDRARRGFARPAKDGPRGGGVRSDRQLDRPSAGGVQIN